MKRLAHSSIFFLFKTLIILALSTVLAGCPQENPELEDAQNEMPADDKKLQLSIEDLVNKAQPVINLSVNQWVTVNQADNPRWRLGIGRNDKNSTEVLRSEQGFELKFRFIQPGEYTVSVESIVSKSELSADQAPNIQKYPLNFNIQ